jgi:hypothetical protein
LSEAKDPQEKNIPISVVSRNPDLEHPKNIQPIEGQQTSKAETQKQPAWK